MELSLTCFQVSLLYKVKISSKRVALWSLCLSQQPSCIFQSTITLNVLTYSYDFNFVEIGFPPLNCNSRTLSYMFSSFSLVQKSKFHQQDQLSCISQQLSCISQSTITLNVLPYSYDFNFVKIGCPPLHCKSRFLFYRLTIFLLSPLMKSF